MDNEKKALLQLKNAYIEHVNGKQIAELKEMGELDEFVMRNMINYTSTFRYMDESKYNDLISKFIKFSKINKNNLKLYGTLGQELEDFEKMNGYYGKIPMLFKVETILKGIFKDTPVFKNGVPTLDYGTREKALKYFEDNLPAAIQVNNSAHATATNTSVPVAIQDNNSAHATTTNTSVPVAIQVNNSSHATPIQGNRPQKGGSISKKKRKRRKTKRRK